MARKYELKRRAENLTATRERIVEATVELHDSLGPARTTISAIAERAGVQRLTVYRHFPDDRALFQACSSHWTAQNPKPDPSLWAEIDDPEHRLRIALTEIYAYYRATEGMTGNLLRDLPQLPVLQEVAAPLIEYWQTVRAVLDRGWSTRGHKRTLLRAVVGHAVAFETWHSLTRREALAAGEAVQAMVSLARAAEYHGRPRAAVRLSKD
jgi:AcrR family transcriptional regulator